MRPCAHIQRPSEEVLNVRYLASVTVREWCFVCMHDELDTALTPGHLSRSHLVAAARAGSWGRRHCIFLEITVITLHKLREVTP